MKLLKYIGHYGLDRLDNTEPSFRNKRDRHRPISGPRR